MISYKIELDTAITANCAELWDELTPEQFRQVIALQLATPQNPTDTEKEIFYIGLMRIFIQVDKKLFYQLPVMDSMYAEYYHIALRFLEEPTAHVSLMPTINVGKKQYQGPQAGFTGLTLEQMAVVEICMEAFCENPTEEMLNQMVAAMYYQYGNEVEICSKKLAELTAKLATVDYVTKYAAYANYRSLRAVVPARCNHLFGDGKASEKPTTEQWEDMFSTLAKDGPHQEGQVRKTEAIRALRWLNNELDLMKAKHATK